ncbi:MAG: 2,3-diphosphoglycerate-dependent phosphoglycerate mutase [Pseudomonadota bacterium]
MTRLVLLRHGQSLWNLENRFTGWVDVDLTEQGEDQARRAGALMAEAGFAPDRAYASYLKRAIKTLWLSLDALDRAWIPVTKSWRLNERHYGALTGLNKAETIDKHGEDQVRVWRRSFDTPPPLLDANDDRHPRFDPRYADLDPNTMPAGESLKLTLDRVRPYFEAEIAPALEDGGEIIIAAHGNSLRAIVMMLFNVSADEIMKVEIPTGNPLLIDLENTQPRQARYLDTARATELPAIG